MTTKQIIRFLENADSTSIEFRPFNLAPKDKYPTFTICYTGYDAHWNKAQAIFRTFGLHPSKFGEMLKGEDVFSYEYNYTSRLYKKTPVDIRDYPHLDIQRFSLKISEVLTGLEFGTQPEDNGVSFGSSDFGKRLDRIPLEVGFNTSDTVCFTRSSEEPLDTLRTYDWLSFNKSVLTDERFKNVVLKIFVHYPNQLMRSFHMPAFRSILGETSYSWTKLLKITIGKVTILRKRAGSNVPCDEDLIDDDAKFQEELMKHIKCTPMYWRERDGDNFPTRRCQSKADLQTADIFIQQYKNILKSYPAPCNQMEVFTKYDDWEETNDWNDARIVFLYHDSVYEEITNTKSFNLESFVSGVGGFIGIFLGYSILQFPELIGLLATFMRNFRRDNIKRMAE